jgi:hypothetical protein
MQLYVIKVCQRLATGQWFSMCTPVSFTNKTDRHNIAEILLKFGIIHQNTNPNWDHDGIVVAFN